MQVYRTLSFYALIIKGQLIHPEILEGLAKSGHFSQVLIADGNYPVATGTNPLSKKVYLNLKPGLLSCMDVLEVVLGAIPVQEVTVMTPPEDYQPDILRITNSFLAKELNGVKWNDGTSTIRSNLRILLL